MKIKSIDELSEGAVLQAFMSNRLFNANKNVISVTTGSTGSGKSYRDLRVLELHYQKHFKDRFKNLNERIMQNVCFSISDFADRLTSKDLKRGELLLLEEWGINLGNLDFQNKISKLFTYVLQSFRSKNIGLVLNLPVMMMMNKSARQLCHLHVTMSGVSKSKKTSTSKVKFLQLNESSGKVYEKHLRIFVNGVSTAVKKFNYSLPSKELREMYEEKKDNFVDEQTKKLKEKIEEQENGKKKPVTQRMKNVNYCYHTLKLRSPTDVAKSITKMEGYKVIQPTISHLFAKLDVNYPNWRENPSILGL